jgi:hypothetical protein
LAPVTKLAHAEAAELFASRRDAREGHGQHYKGVSHIDLLPTALPLMLQPR